MNQFQHYLLDEFVEDYREGRVIHENRGLLGHHEDVVRRYR